MLSFVNFGYNEPILGYLSIYEKIRTSSIRLHVKAHHTGVISSRDFLAASGTGAIFWD